MLALIAVMRSTRRCSRCGGLCAPRNVLLLAGALMSWAPARSGEPLSHTPRWVARQSVFDSFQ